MAHVWNRVTDRVLLVDGQTHAAWQQVTNH